MTSAVVTAAPVARTRAPLGRLLRAELRWIFRRPRTLIAITLLGLTPVMLGIGTVFMSNQAPEGGEDPMFAMAVGNAFALPVIALSMTMVFLLPLVCTMSAADAIAGESGAGTLRGLLIAPVGRGRLLAVKAFGVTVVVLVATSMIALMALLTGLVINGTSAMITLSGTTLTFGEALGRIALITLWVALQMLGVCAIALAVSTLTEHPLIVLASTVGGLIVFGILGVIPALDWLHPFLLPHGWQSTVDILRDPIATDGLSTGALRALCYIVIGYSLAYARLSTKDG